MALDILDRAVSGLGLTIKPQDQNIDRARDYALGNRAVGPGRGVDLPGIGANSPGGLIPAYETMARDREAYIQDFTGERERVQSQVEENRMARRPFNEAAAGALPDLISGATTEGFLSRIDDISASPQLQAVIDRENNRRMRAAQSSLAAGGLTRSGAAAAAAADATLTPEERAFQIEPELYRRSAGLANMYQDLPIANQMVLDTYQRDMMMADNLARQGGKREAAELAKGQMSAKAAETMLTNLIKAYGDATKDGGTTIVNQVSNTLSDLIGDIVARGGEAVAGMTDWVSGVLGDIFGDGGGGDPPIDIPPFVIPTVPDVNTPGSPSVNVPDIPPFITPTVPDTNTPGFPSVNVPDSPVAAPTPTPAPAPPVIAPAPAPAPAPVPAPIPPVAEAPPAAQTPGDDQNYGELPLLKNITLPGLNKPGLDINDTIDDITGDIAGNILGDITDDITGSITGNILDGGGASAGGDFGSNFAPQPDGGGAPPPVDLPGLGTAIGSSIAAYGGREVGQAVFGKDATQSWGSTAGAAIGMHVGGPVGAIIGSFIGSLVDSAFGTSDQKNVTIGAATTKPGDDLTGELDLPSGLKLYGISRRGGDGSSTQNYMNSLGNIDNFLTEAARQGGFNVSLSNEGFGGEVKGKGKNLKDNPTFFGSATEGSRETDKAHVGRNIAEGYNRFIDSWLTAAVDQGQITGPMADQVRNLSGTAEEKMASFAQLMNAGQAIEPRFDVTVPEPPKAAGSTQPIRSPSMAQGGRMY